MLIKNTLRTLFSAISKVGRQGVEEIEDIECSLEDDSAYMYTFI